MKRNCACAWHSIYPDTEDNFCDPDTAAVVGRMGPASDLEAAIEGGAAAPADAAGFAAARARLRAVGGAAALCAHLEASGFVADGKLTTGTTPFNVFARIAGGAMAQPGMEAENHALGEFSTRFCVAANRPDNDANWASEDERWVGKASMGERHRFLTTRDLSWQWFNVLSFGIEGDAVSLRASIAELEALQAAAFAFASRTPGWAGKDHIGLYFHCFPYNSVNSLHLHMVDLSSTGPSFAYHAHKNLPLSAALAVLRAELRLASPLISDRWGLSWSTVAAAAVAALCLLAVARHK